MKPSHSTPAAADTSWAVHRIDDNGNCFVVESGLTQTKAEKLQVHYESLHHKQTYWIKQTKQP